MRKEDMIARYEELYDRMSRSGDVRNMRTFGEAERAVFAELAGTNPDTAARWLERLEPMDWDSYLSEREAREISRAMRNQDDSSGFRWNDNDFFAAARGFGIREEERPRYNRYALLVAANMVYSDHARSIAEDMGKASPSDVDDTMMMRSCCRKALELLDDPDGGFRIREYFAPVIHRK